MRFLVEESEWSLSIEGQGLKMQTVEIVGLEVSPRFLKSGSGDSRCCSVPSEFVAAFEQR